VICGFHRVVLEEPGLLSCCALWWVSFSRRFEETCRLNLPRYESIHGIVTLKMRALPTLDNSGSNHSTTQINNPEAHFRDTKTGVQVLKCLSFVSISVGNAKGPARSWHGQAVSSLSYCLAQKITLPNTDYAHKISQIISVKHVQHPLWMDHKGYETCRRF